MSAKKFILVTIALFIAGALPFLIVQPTAAASAGLSLGFTAPLGHPLLLVLLLLMGMLCALLPRDGLAMVPMAYVLMLMAGGMMTLDMQQFTGMRYFVLGAMLCLALLVGMARIKINVLALLMMASVGFHLGGASMLAVPAMVSPLYFLLGNLLSLTMILAIAIAFSVTLLGDHEGVWERMKRSRHLAFFRLIFR